MNLNWQVKLLILKEDKKMGNIKFSFSEDGHTAYGELPNGTVFMIDADMVINIKSVNFYLGARQKGCGQKYIIDSNGRYLHDYLFEHRNGYEIDHINLDTFDNRRCNIRYCTHQQNQINQPLQKNNTSGVCGVSYYSPRNKFRARIKIGQHDIHLGYYCTFLEAVQARNVGMKCMFGEYGRYNDVPEAPNYIKEYVTSKCERFAELSVSKAFLLERGVR